MKENICMPEITGKNYLKCKSIVFLSSETPQVINNQPYVNSNFVLFYCSEYLVLGNLKIILDLNNVFKNFEFFF